MTGKWQGSTRAKQLPPDWPKRRARILKRDPICRICRMRSSTQVDHLVRGEDHSDSNLRGVCDPCHALKSSREGSAARHRFKRKRANETHPGLGGGG